MSQGHNGRYSSFKSRDCFPGQALDKFWLSNLVLNGRKPTNLGKMNTEARRQVIEKSGRPKDAEDVGVDKENRLRHDACGRKSARVLQRQGERLKKSPIRIAKDVRVNVPLKPICDDCVATVGSTQLLDCIRCHGPTVSTLSVD